MVMVGHPSPRQLWESPSSKLWHALPSQISQAAYRIRYRDVSMNEPIIQPTMKARISEPTTVNNPH